MPDFAVSTAFTPIDKVSAAFKNMGRNATNFGNKAALGFKKANRSGSVFGGTLKAILSAGVISRGIGLLREGIGATVREFISFDQAIVSSSAKFKGLNIQTEAGQKTLLELKKTARDVGAATQFSAGEAAQGLDFLAMAGFNAEQSMALLPGVTNLATVANVDLARSTDIASDALGAFGLMTEDSVQLQKNFTRQNDVMALTMSRTNTGIEDMFESVKKGAPAFTAAGQSLETFNALVGIMANSGVKGAESGTQLRNVMLRLASPTKEAQKQLKAMGVVTQDSKGNFRDVVDILGDLEKGTKKMGTAQKTAALATIFGARSVTGINILLQAGTKSIRGFREELLDAAGASVKMANIMRGSLGNRLKALQSAAFEIGFKFIEAFEKQGGGAIDSFTQFLRNLDVQPFINGLKVLVKGMIGLFKIIKFLSPFLISLGVAFVAFKTIMVGMAIVSTVQKAFLLLTSALKAVAVAQGILNAIMTANPIGLIVVGIAALIAGIVLLVIHWDTVTEVIKKNTEAFLLFLGPIGTLINMVLILRKHWSTIVDAFKNKGMVAGIKAIGLAILDFMLAPLRGVLQILAKLPFATDFAKNALSKLQIDVDKADVQRESPNSEEVKAQQSEFKGNININGAPQGTTVESRSKGPNKVNMQLAGAAP